MPEDSDSRLDSTPNTPPSHDAVEAAPLAALGRWIRQALGRSPEHSLKEALQEMLEEHEDAERSVDSDELTLLRNMVAFGEIKVSDVMIPRTDIVAASQSASLEEIKQLIATERHTRIPLYDDSLDHITGFLHLKDLLICLLDESETFDLPTLRRDILFVPASMKIIDLLLKMRVASCHIAIVVDEYGGTDGLVSMEDLFEEIVGEIHDEHDDDTEDPQLKWINDSMLEVDARLEVEALSEALALDFVNGHSVDDFDTIGGLIFSHLGRIPAKGEVIDYSDDIKFEILSADPRRIRKVKVVRI
jgi:magnesium and cobalt transporter